MRYSSGSLEAKGSRGNFPRVFLVECKLSPTVQSAFLGRMNGKKG